jgi:CTD small phosphatase-like protein 2
VPPYLPPLPDDEKRLTTFTLALDLDETLVHFQETEEGGGQFLIRPYAEMFLVEMAKYYELVIFTAAVSEYADFIIDIIDPKKLIKHRLY